jgi:hypothetical protein
LAASTIQAHFNLLQQPSLFLELPDVLTSLNLGTNIPPPLEPANAQALHDEYALERRGHLGTHSARVPISRVEHLVEPAVQRERWTFLGEDALWDVEHGGYEQQALQQQHDDQLEGVRRGAGNFQVVRPIIYVAGAALLAAALHSGRLRRLSSHFDARKKRRAVPSAVLEEVLSLLVCFRFQQPARSLSSLVRRCWFLRCELD